MIAAALRRAALLGCLALASATTGASTSLRFCAGETERDATQQDRVLQVAAKLREQLAAHGQPAALLARAGTQLGRFGLRYTHAALVLEDHPLTPWGVRQLYFACDERRSRLFDQGLAGFLLGADDPDRGFASLLLLPAQAAESLAAAGADREQALALLDGEYMANAHPQDLLRQNCNQWLAELLALGWGQAAAGTVMPNSARAQAQAQLQRWGYAPEPVHYGSPIWRWLAAFVPWVSMQGHPPEDLAANRLVTSLPPDLEGLTQRLWPAALRVELCYTPSHWVLRRSGAPLSADCRAEAGDESGRF